MSTIGLLFNKGSESKNPKCISLINSFKPNYRKDTLSTIDMVIFSLDHKTVKESNVTLMNMSYGPAKLILWLVFAILLIFSVILLSGHGEGLIAGYNTAREEEKEKYNKKRLTRTVGYGLSFITLLVLIMALFIDVLPSYFAFIFAALVLITAALMIYLANTMCRRK